MRRGENAAVPECARTEFARPLHPPDDPPGGEIIDNALDQRRLVELLYALTVLARRSRETGCIDGRTPEWMIGHVAIGIAKIDSVRVERCTQRASGIARRGRHEQTIESGLGENAGVRDAVQCDAAAETQIGQPRFATKPRGDVDERLFEYALNARGAIGKAPSLG